MSLRHTRESADGACDMRQSHEEQIHEILHSAEAEWSKGEVASIGGYPRDLSGLFLRNEGSHASLHGDPE